MGGNMAISWSHWVFSAHKLDDHDVWVLSNTHFGGGFDFDKQTSGQRQGRQWYARQHNPEAGRYYLEMSSMAEAEKWLGAARLKQVTDRLPRRCRGVMRFDYVSRPELDGVEIDDELNRADWMYFDNLGLNMANHMNRDWGWPTVVATFQPGEDRSKDIFAIWSPDKQTRLPLRQHPRRVAMRGCQSHPTSRRGYSSYRGQRRWPGAHENVDGTVIVGMPRSKLPTIVTIWRPRVRARPVTSTRSTSPGLGATAARSLACAPGGAWV